MKVCDKCGALNSDTRFFCVDCNEKLGDPVSDREQGALEQGLDTTLENLYNQNDPLHVSRFDKVMGWLSVIGTAASLTLWGIGLFTKRDFDLLWIAVLFFAVSAVEAFVPKLTWGLEKLRLSFYIANADDAEPGMFYKVCRKASLLICTGVGVVGLIFAAADFRHPPVAAYIADIANTKSVAMSSHSRDYINANPEKWDAILDAGDYAVSVFTEQLQSADQTGLEEVLMMQAIVEITGDKTLSCADKDVFLFDLYTRGWDAK